MLAADIGINPIITCLTGDILSAFAKKIPVPQESDKSKALKILIEVNKLNEEYIFARNSENSPPAK